MTTEQDAAADAAEESQLIELPVMLLDREIFCRAPSPEQLLVWQRTIDRLTKAPVNISWTGSEVMAALERLRKIVDSLVINPADIMWMDDQFLEGTLDFRRLTPFITDVINKFQEYVDSQIQENGTRAERRAVVKKAAKKATRKAPR